MTACIILIMTMLLKCQRYVRCTIWIAHRLTRTMMHKWAMNATEMAQLPSLPWPLWCASPPRLSWPLSGWWGQCWWARRAGSWEGSSGRLPRPPVYLQIKRAGVDESTGVTPLWKQTFQHCSSALRKWCAVLSNPSTGYKKRNAVNETLYWYYNMVPLALPDVQTPSPSPGDTTPISHHLQTQNTAEHHVGVFKQRRRKTVLPIMLCHW